MAVSDSILVSILLNITNIYYMHVTRHVCINDHTLTVLQAELSITMYTGPNGRGISCRDHPVLE